MLMNYIQSNSQNFTLVQCCFEGFLVGFEMKIWSIFIGFEPFCMGGIRNICTILIKLLENVNLIKIIGFGKFEGDAIMF
jgi:hypothetical protein